MVSNRDNPVDIRALVVGSMENNVYVLVCPETSEAVLVDAADEAERILEAVRDLKVSRILQTHGHSDHVQALEKVKEALGAPVGVHPGDAAMLPVKPDFLLADGDRISFGNQELLVLHTPGHTAGSVCLLVGNTLISGDTLFPGGPGNTATPLGNFDLIIRSIRTKLFTLPDDTLVLPGHGLGTTVGTEQPHLDEWIERRW